MTQKAQTSLYTKVLLLVFIPSAFLIVVFITIELTLGAKTVTAEHATRAQLASLLIHEKLQAMKQEDLPLDAIKEKVKEISLPLIKSGLLDYATLLTPSVNIIFSIPKPTSPNPDDPNRIQNILSSEQIVNQWLYSYQNDREKMMDVYLPIYLNHEIAYFYKTSFSLGKMGEVFRRIYVSAAITIFIILSIAVFLTQNLLKRIIFPLKELNEATKEVMTGNFSRRVEIQANNEIGILANTFNEMAANLASMKERAENANPLTHLPGNNVIQAEINKRIQVGAKFVVIYGDLDNFKAYNDAYGIEKGDQVIQLAANTIKEAVEKKGGSGDFLGHEGGDDFVVITTPTHADEIARYVISEFGEKVKSHYNEEDRKQGFILGHERRMTEEPEELPLVPFPLMTISLAGISNEKSAFANYADVTNRLVEIKHSAKTRKGNIFIWKR